MRHRVSGPPRVEAPLVRTFSFGDTGKLTPRSVAFKRVDSPTTNTIHKGSDEPVLQRSLSFKNWEKKEVKVQANDSFKNLVTGLKADEPMFLQSASDAVLLSPTEYLPVLFSSPRPLCELDAAAVKLQKVYKSYRTRRNLADCAVVVEELWWKALDFASLKHSSVSFFKVEKHETAVSRWTRARTRAAKVGKGLSKDEKAQKLALRHWLEAIDPRHRYGHNLNLYYDVWFDSESTQPFFYWLDIGDGKEVNIEKCPRSRLQSQCIKYLGPNEREEYEVVVEDGKLLYKQSRALLTTMEGSKWIFVLSTSRALYVGQKKKGTFQHSSFLAGGAIIAAGRLVVKEGILSAIWPYSGHYLPTEENFREFIGFLEDNSVDLTNVKRCSVDDDVFPSFAKQADEQPKIAKIAEEATSANNTVAVDPLKGTAKISEVVNPQASGFDLARRLSCKWTTAVGARIECVRDYPVDLQFKALEQVNLSPRITSCIGNKVPIPSPRPSPKIRLSPRLQYMGIPSPRLSINTSQS